MAQRDINREKLVLAWISDGRIHHAFEESKDKLRDTGFWNGARINLVSGPRIAEARSQVFDNFLLMPDKPEWILCVDTDMEFEPDDVVRTWRTANRTNRQVVGGLCFAGGHTACVPTIYETIELEDGTPAPCIVSPEKAREMIALKAPIKVAATGGGFLLVHRTVIERMKLRHPHGFGTYADGKPNPYPWWVEGQHIGGQAMGEDVMFTWRAHLLGFGVHVHTGIEIGHWKERPLNLALWRQLSEQADTNNLSLRRSA